MGANLLPAESRFKSLEKAKVETAESNMSFGIPSTSIDCCLGLEGIDSTSLEEGDKGQKSSL
jgi:hypothetical protein